MTTIRLILTMIIGLMLARGAMAAADNNEKSAKDRLLEKVVEPETLEEIKKQIGDIEKLKVILSGIKGDDPTKPAQMEPASVEVVDESSASGEREADVVEPLSLTAIFISGKNRQAVINGRIIKEGENVSDRTVHRIYKNKIIVEDFDTIREISLPTTNIRTNIK